MTNYVNNIDSTDAEYYLKKLQEFFGGSSYDKTLVQYYKTLIQKLRKIMNEEKTKQYALSSLYSLRVSTEDAVFSSILLENLRFFHISMDEWEAFKAKRDKKLVPIVKEEEPSLFSMLEGFNN